MKTQSTSRAVLGIYVSDTSLEGVLMEASEGPARIVHRMVRQRQRKGEMVGSGNLESVVPGLKTSDESDFTIEIGDGSNAGLDPSMDMMAAELGNRTGGSNGNGSSAEGPSMSLPFDRQLKEMVGECAGLGYPNPEIAFCVTPPEVSFVELVVPGTSSEKSSSGTFSRVMDSGDTSRKKLLELLDKQHSASYDRDRVAFYPMAPRNGSARFLAVVPASRDTVTRSLANLHDRRQSLEATPRLVEAEATLLASVIRRQSGIEETTSAIVRVGLDDTLILFFEGSELRHYERLRSLTSYDVPDTICSRVMLQQDEQKIGALDMVYVVGAHEERLTEAFSNFYPDAAVFSLREAISPEEWEASDEVEWLSPSRMAAVTAALRVLYPPGDGEGVNLIGTAPRRRRRSLSLAGHTYGAIVLLFAVIGFFGWQYMANEAEIAQQRELLAQEPAQMLEMTPEAIRAEVQELQATYMEHTQALAVLDSLLVGSDLWSRTLAHTSSLTGSIDQIWFRGWQPQGNGIRIEGFALSRGNVATLNRHLGGVIERLEYNEANNVRIYGFTIQAPLSREMPEVALYLREVAEGVPQDEVLDDVAPLLEDSTPHE